VHTYLEQASILIDRDREKTQQAHLMARQTVTYFQQQIDALSEKRQREIARIDLQIAELTSKRKRLMTESTPADIWARNNLATAQAKAASQTTSTHLRQVVQNWVDEMNNAITGPLSDATGEQARQSALNDLGSLIERHPDCSLLTDAHAFLTSLQRQDFEPDLNEGYGEPDL
jgi:hypothetical protein